MTLGELLQRSADRVPDKPAIIFKDRQISFQELNADANKLAKALNALGVGKGDKVGIMMPNCPEFIVGVFAALKAGAASVSINGLLQASEVTYVINHSDAKAIITAPPYDEFLAMLRPKFPNLQHILTTAEEPEDDGLISIPSSLEFYDDSNLKPTAQLNEVASIYYTSGTTGLPKGAMLSHVNILSNCAAIIKAVQASRNDTVLTCLPLFHAFAMTPCVMLPIFGGMTNVLLESFLPQPVLKGFHDWKVTFFLGVPTMYAVLANMPNIEQYDVSHFRIGFCGAAPLTKAIVEKFESKYPGKIYEGYGLSECSPVVSVNPIGHRKIGSIGKPLDERIQWKIVDQDGKEVPRGIVGEIIVKGPNVMKGYYKNEEATKGTILKGWFHTGDLAHMDKDGFVFIADRMKDMIIVGGENVYPKEVEDALMQHPAIQDAGVIGVDDPIRGEVPKAYIVPELGATVDERDILNFCRKHLAPFKVPRSIEVIEDIPRNPTGKILKRILRRLAAGLPAEEEEDDFDEDFEDEEEGELEVDEEEFESPVEVVEEPQITAPPIGGPNLEEQMRQLEGGAMPPPPQPGGGSSLEEQMRQLEGGGMPQPPTMEAHPEPSYEEGAGFEEYLRRLVMDIPGGIAGSIAGFDGIGISSFSTDPDFQTTIADAELAGIMTAVKKAAQSLSAGNPQEAFFVSDQYGFVLRSIRDQYFVSLVLEAQELNWGLTRLHINKIVPLIEKELF
jgi:long-chain acyl-CoA synthetase